MTTKREMLGNIQVEIEVVNTTLLVAHVNIEGVEVDGWKGLTGEDFDEVGKAVRSVDCVGSARA